MADLILPGGSPLKDTSNTPRTSSLILSGQVLDRGPLDELLRQAAQARATGE